MFLAKLGSILIKTFSIISQLSGFVPLVKPLLPPKVGEQVQEYADDLTKVGGVVITVEQMFAHAFGPDAKTGAQKLAAAAPFVRQILLQSELVIHHKISDEARFNKGIDQIVSGMVDVLSGIEEDKK